MPNLTTTTFEKTIEVKETFFYLDFSVEERQLLSCYQNFQEHSIENFVMYGLYVYDLIKQYQIKNNLTFMQKSNFTKFMESKKLDCMSPLDLKLLTYIVRSIQKKVDWGEGSIKRHIDPLLKQQVSQKNKALYQIFYCALRDWQMADVNKIDDIYKNTTYV